MDSNEDKIIEVQFKKTVRRVWKKLLKSINSEPKTLVIESDNTQADTSEEASVEIRKWLFRRR